MTLLLWLSLVFTPARSAEQPSLLYATANKGTELIAIGLEAKRVRVIGEIGFPSSLPLAFCPPGGVRYTITNQKTTNAQLATLNLGTGAATPVGSPLGQALSIMGMTCSPDGTLYAVGQADPSKPDFNSLYTVNPKTGLASLIGSTGVRVQGPYSGFLMALAFAPDGILYGANVSTLFRVDPSTGQATKVVDFVGVTSVMGLAIDSDGNFYVSDWVALPPGGAIYALNVATGVATPILNTGLAFVHNIAFKASAEGVPIKGTFTVAATVTPNTGKVTYCGGTPLDFAVEAHGSGYSTLGALSLSLQKTVGGPAMHGCLILTALNGDTLSATYDGTEGTPNANNFVVDASGTLTFTGGTGRFRGASGSAHFTGVFSRINPPSSVVGGTPAPRQVMAFYSVEGTVSLPESHGDQ